MEETLHVTFSGTSLAFLLYENVKSTHEQEGFLLGDVNTVITKTITDSSSQKENQQNVINITGVIPCPQTCLFYDSVGRVNEEKLLEILGPKSKNVVAWFQYEPYSSLKLTMRSKLIHKQLSTIFHNSPELFTCCLLSSSCNELRSIHTYKQVFLRYHRQQFETVPLHIENLGESHNHYKPISRTSKPFSAICKSLKLNETKSCDIKTVTNIQNTLQIKTKEAMEELHNSERIREQLECEVQELRKQLQLRLFKTAEKDLDDKICEDNSEELFEEDNSNEYVNKRTKSAAEDCLVGDNVFIDLTMTEEEDNMNMSKNVS